MPLIVDHDERRRRFAAIAGRLIAVQGVEAITLRDVAREAGCSTAAVLHYFRDKLHLLLSACHEARARAIAFVEDARAGGVSPMDCLAEFLPLDEQRRLDWLMWFGFWGKAAAEPAIATERMDGVGNAHGLMMRLLKEIDPPTACDLAKLATSVQAVINGIASLAVIDVEHWPAERQRLVLRSLLQPILSGHGQGGNGLRAVS
jgi:AcrR family transcriptional regulator